MHTQNTNIPITQSMPESDTEERTRLRQKIREQRLKGYAQKEQPVVSIPRQTAHENELLLSSAQRRIWFMDQLNPDSALYNMHIALRLQGDLDHNALELALAAMMQRHEILRTAFDTNDKGEPTMLLTTSTLQLQEMDFSSVVEEERETIMRTFAQKEINKPFDLRVAPLLRANLLMLGEKEDVLLLIVHHILADGWSLDILFNEMVQLYEAFRNAQPSPLAALLLQYSDIAAWQQSAEQEKIGSSQLDYWRAKLAQAPTVLALPTDSLRPAVSDYTGAQYHTDLPEQAVTRLKEYCQRAGVTLFMGLIASYALLLARSSGQDDIMIGTPIAGRTHSEMEPLIGLFVNTLVLRIKLAGQHSFKEVLQQVRDCSLEAYAHQDIPFERIVEAIQPERELSRNPLFQVMFVLEQETLPVQHFTACKVEQIRLEHQTSKFDISLFCTEKHSGGLDISIEYSTELFHAATIEQFCQHWFCLLDSCLRQPEEEIHHLDWLSRPEKSQVLQQWSGAATLAEAGPLCLHQLIEAQAVRTPQTIALREGSRSMTYAEIAVQSSLVAQQLRQKGVGPEVRVGVYLPRLLELVPVLLGILKAGGAYVPLDPTYPQDRLTTIVEDAQPHVIITQEQISFAHQATILTLVELFSKEQAGMSQTPLISTVQPSNLAYILYTSGSTGRPKGVALTHTGACTLIDWAQQTIPPEDLAGVLAVTSINFDLSIFELFLPLASGGCVILVNSIIDIAHLPANYGITLINTVPSAMAQLVNTEALPATVRTICLAGEQLPGTLAQTILQQPQVKQLFNLYGPTEGTTYSTWSRVPTNQEHPTIGQPITGTTTYVLDRSFQPLPAGIPGELYIGGAGLARGYFGQPAMTAERFVPDPFDSPGSRLYRTGDLVKWTTEGALEYLGRLDHQVKLHGYRIELGEIETVLEQHPVVRTGVVVIHQGKRNEQKLIAYVVTHKGEQISSEELRSHLARRLPSYMLPAAFVQLEHMPLSQNGKINRQQLPLLTEQLQTSSTTVAQEPRSREEHLLHEIWQEVLNKKPIGIHDNFFELGGDSILSISIIARAKQHGLTIKPKHIFQYQTIAALAEAAQWSDALSQGQAEAIPTGYTPLLPIQHWFFEQAFTNQDHWNQSILLTADTYLQREAMEQVVATLLQAHDALRSRFYSEQQSWRQEFMPFTPEETQQVFAYYDFSTVCAHEQEDFLNQRCNELQASLNISQGPLVRIALFHCQYQHSYVFMCAHHLGIDGYSWRVLLEDLQQAYLQRIQGISPTLPEKTTSISAWGRQLIQYAQTPSIHAEYDYWQSHLPTQVQELPLDNPQGRNDESVAMTLVTTLAPEETQHLLAIASDHTGTHITALFLTALYQAYHHWSQQPALYLDLESHGRENLFENVDLSRTVGWFTALYPIHIHQPQTQSLQDNLEAIKSQLVHVPNHGIGYGVLRYLSADTQIKTHMQAMPKPAIVFNYLGRFEEHTKQSDLLRFSQQLHSALHSPQAQRSYCLEIDAQIVPEGLQVMWTFSKEQYQQQTIQALGALFTDTLRSIIQLKQAIPTTMNIQQAKPEHADLDLSTEELEDVLAEIDFAEDEEI